MVTNGYWHYFTYIIYSNFITHFYIVKNVYIHLYLFCGCVKRTAQWCGYIFFTITLPAIALFFSGYNYTILLQFHLHFTVDYFFLRPYTAFSELVPLEYRAKSNAPRQLCSSAYLQKYANLRNLVNTGVPKWGGMSPKSVDSKTKVCLGETITIRFLTTVLHQFLNRNHTSCLGNMLLRQISYISSRKPGLCF